MRLELTYRNIEGTDPLRERAERKFNKVAKHLREPIEGHMVLQVNKHRHRAELTVHAAGEQYFRATEETDDMYASIDGIMNKLARTVRRHKERMLDRTQAGAADFRDGFFVVEEGDMDELLEMEAELESQSPVT